MERSTAEISSVFNACCLNGRPQNTLKACVLQLPGKEQKACRNGGVKGSKDELVQLQ